VTVLEKGEPVAVVLSPAEFRSGWKSKTASVAEAKARAASDDLVDSSGSGLSAALTDGGT